MLRGQRPAMIEDECLGISRRSRCVDDLMGLRERAHLLVERRPCDVQFRVEIDEAALRRCECARPMDEYVAKRRAALELRHVVRQVGRHHRHPRFALVQLERQFLALGAGIDRDGKNARDRTGDDRVDILGIVAHQQRHAITLAEAALVPECGEAIGTGPQVAEMHRPLAVAGALERHDAGVRATLRLPLNMVGENLVVEDDRHFPLIGAATRFILRCGHICFQAPRFQREISRARYLR